MQREADKRTRQRTDTAEVDDSRLQRLGVDEEVVLLDVALDHHQRLTRNLDRWPRGAPRKVIKNLQQKSSVTC